MTLLLAATLAVACDEPEATNPSPPYEAAVLAMVQDLQERGRIESPVLFVLDDVLIVDDGPIAPFDRPEAFLPRSPSSTFVARMSELGARRCRVAAGVVCPEALDARPSAIVMAGPEQASTGTSVTAFLVHVTLWEDGYSASGYRTEVVRGGDGWTVASTMIQWTEN